MGHLGKNRLVGSVAVAGVPGPPYTDNHLPMQANPLKTGTFLLSSRTYASKCKQAAAAGGADGQTTLLKARAGQAVASWEN